jgi:cobalt/nickel transport system ATP-binding protein
MLTVKDLLVSYTGDKTVVDGVSFTLSTGENIALVGANGAGKTTLLHALVGVVPVAGGEICVDDVTLGKGTLRRIRSHIGLVFQTPDDQLFMPNIFEDAAFGLRAYGYNETDVKERVAATLAELGISHLRECSPLKLSGGERRLCAIAAVLAMKPEYLLFDEPTAFLDPRARRSLALTLNNLPQGKLIATHDLSFAESFCTRVLIIKEGKIMCEGGVELLRDADTLESAGL